MAYQGLDVGGKVVLVSREVAVDGSLAPDLDTAAMDAVKQWTFEPATQGGKPVPVIFNLTINFTLK